MAKGTSTLLEEGQALLPTTKTYGSVSDSIASKNDNDSDGINNNNDDKMTRTSTALWQRRWKLLFLGVGATFLVVVGTVLMVFQLRRKHNNKNYNTAIMHNNNHDNDCVWTNLHCSSTSNNSKKHTTTCWIRPSEYETCLEAISLDTVHFLQSIQALDDTFREWYPFYHNNQALDHPPMETTTTTTPAHKNKLQREYQVYSATVDLHTLLSNVQDDVQQHGATMASVWKVNEAFTLLRDAHVHAIKGTIGNLTSNFWSGLYDLAIFPPETWDAMMQQQEPQVVIEGDNINDNNDDENKNSILYKTVFFYDTTPSFDDAGGGVPLSGWEQTDEMDTNFDAITALRLTIERYDAQGRLFDTRDVHHLDGLTPGEFVLRLAKYSPMRNLALRSVGPRVNSLLHRNFATTHPQPTFFKLSRSERLVPHDFLFQNEDSFVVEYDNGTKETFHVGIAVTSDDVPALTNYWPSSMVKDNFLVVNIQEIEHQANQPSCLYRNFAMGIAKTHPALWESTANSSSSSNNNKTRHRRVENDATDEQGGEIILEHVCDIDDQGWWTKSYHCNKGFRPPYDEDGPLDMAYSVMGDFIVFKLDSFDGPPGIIFPLWREMNKVAVEHDIHKLMIDISSNGGGEVPLGLYLSQLMYPEVSCEMFQNKYDMSYNEPMAVWAKAVAPVLIRLKNQWSEMSIDGKAKAWSHISTSQYKEIVTVAEAMCILDLDHSKDFCGNVEDVHETCPLLVAARSLRDTPTLNAFFKFVETYLDFMSASNPWTVLAEFDVHVDIGERTSIRGGKATNFTNFLKHEPDFPIWWDCPPLEEVNVFSEYIMVSNGNSGSTTSTLQTTVEQIWKNRNISGALRPATMVSYGGLGQNTPLTQFAGGTVDSRVNVEVPYAGLAGLPLLVMLVSGILVEEENSDDIAHVADRLHQTLPQVPYYFEHFSQLPAVEIYNKFLYDNDSEMMPLEFIYFPPDHHIRDIYTGSVFDNAEGFEKLYRQASQYFLRI